jgi:peptidoglycan/LPS O-acetylase OafA/YrhL
VEFRLGHRPALDGVRGLAILTVMGVHTGGPFLEGGFLSVDLFFVLSGFLITSVLFEEWRRTGSVHLARFYARRALRLLPGLLVLLVFLALWSLSFPVASSAAEVRREIVYTFFYAANWALAFDAMSAMGFLGHAWTLAIEEQFYLAWPLMLLVMLKKGIARGGLALITAAIAVAAGLHRFAMWQDGASIERLFFGFDTRCDALLAGCLAALVATFPGRLATPLRRRLWRVAGLASTAVLAAMWVLASREQGYMYTWGFSLAAATSALLLIEIIDHPDSLLSKVFAWRPLVHVGHISYGLYLWHWPVFLTLALERPDWSTARLNLARFAVTFVLAQLSSSLVEQPSLRWKKRWSA